MSAADLHIETTENAQRITGDAKRSGKSSFAVCCNPLSVLSLGVFDLWRLERGFPTLHLGR